MRRPECVPSWHWLLALEKHNREVKKKKAERERAEQHKKKSAASAAALVKAGGSAPAQQSKKEKKGKGGGWRLKWANAARHLAASEPQASPAPDSPGLARLFGVSGGSGAPPPPRSRCPRPSFAAGYGGPTPSRRRAR